MSTYPLMAQERRDVYTGAGARTGVDRVVLTLMTLGLIAASVAFIDYQAAVKVQLQPDEFFSATIVKSPTYYAAHAIQVVLLFVAGLLALAYTDTRMIQRGYLRRFILLVGAVLLMTARGYSTSDLLSVKLVDATGPFPFLIAVLVFVAARRNNWRYLSNVMVLLATLFSVLSLLGMAGLHTFSRQEAVAAIGGTLTGLFWPASWLVLTPNLHPALLRRLRFVPIVIYVLGSLFVQTRLNVVMIFGLIAVYAYLEHKRHVSRAAGWIATVAMLSWLCLFTSVFLRDTRVYDRLDSVAAAFSSRLDDDTRTGQLQSFGEDVAPHELLLGRGSFASWNWSGVSWKGGTDVGYLSLLFFGGVPLMLTYFVTHLMPALEVLRTKATDVQLTSAGVVLLWGLRMFSSSYSGLGIDYYPILFCVGICISRDTSGDCCSRVV